MRKGICATGIIKALLLCSLIICGFSCIPDEGNNPKVTLYPTPVSTTSWDDLPTSDWIGPDGETAYEYVQQYGYSRGADGHYILLVNNPQARDPTWAELIDFLQQDDTDKHLYNDSFKCADFAEMLHNRAESAGIMTAYVVIELQNIYTAHILNAFNTTDKGLVYIDVTGSDEYSPCSFDCIVDVEPHQEYLCSFLFPCTDTAATSLGIVSEVFIYW